MIPIDNTIPIYLQISQHIEGQILNGQLQAEDKVPSTNDFARIMHINPSTAGKGLNELVDQGILYKKRGLGMFVSPQAPDIVLKKSQQHFKETTVPECVRQAKQLNIDVEEFINIIRGEYDA